MDLVEKSRMLEVIRARLLRVEVCAKHEKNRDGRSVLIKRMHQLAQNVADLRYAIDMEIEQRR